jgi:sulfatase modifying factor 1
MSNLRVHLPCSTVLPAVVITLAFACSHADRLDELEQLVRRDAGFDAGTIVDAGDARDVGIDAPEPDARCDGVMCGARCVTDSETNAEACGSSCTRCTTLVSNAVPACAASECTFRCAPTFRLRNGECEYRPSCVEQERVCGDGVEGIDDPDCCSAIEQTSDLADLTYRRSHDGAGSSQAGETVLGWQDSDSVPVTLSPFSLDRYEVTVGRFRRFVEDYDTWRAGGDNPRAEFGCHPTVLGTSCWKDVWNTATSSGARLVPADRAELEARITSCSPSSYTLEADARESFPMTCVSWFEAYAFCIWDGGRLPTEAEWNYVATGGPLQRAFPWSDPASSLSTSDASGPRARFDVADAAGAEEVWRRPSGRGRFGHFALAGNVWEWVRDTIDRERIDAYGLAGSDPIRLTDDAIATTRRGGRGGSYNLNATRMRTAYRDAREGTIRLNDIGFRCAR